MDNQKITEGVKCVVNTCNYYKEGNLCSAGRIEITPRNASSSKDTDCATFKPNSMS